MAFCVLLVIITGGIDLSVGSVFSLTGMVTGLAMTHGFGALVSSLAGLSVGLVIGLINGALVTFVGLAPFVVTLSTYAIAGSLSFIFTDGHSLPISDPNYYLLNSGSLIPGLPNYALWYVLLLIAIEFCLRKVVAGRWLYAIGSSSSSARVIGGASLFGGTGSAIGALLGALMITIIQNGANLIGVNSFWQGTVTRIVILIAFLVDRITKARR